MNDCSANPCQNGGVCTDSVDFSTYTCACASGFTGVNCEIEHCDFESGICPGWVQRTDDSLDWTLQKGGTSSTLTGPSFDHSKGNGGEF